MIDEKYFSDSEDVDLQLKTNIEGAIIKWAQQVHDLLQEDSYIGNKYLV